MTAETAPRRRNRSLRRAMLIGVGILLLVGICGGGGYFAYANAQASARQAAAAKWQTAEVKTGSINATVSATGNVESPAQANLNFAVSGTVTKIMVKPGDRVKAGDPLAQIDSTDLQLNLEKAQAELKSAQADYQKLRSGATPEEIAQARAQLAQAQGQYQQTAGSVTQADIDAARAKLEAAQANLARLEAGHTDLSDAEAELQKAQTALATRRDSLSADKTRAQLALEQAANDLTKAQAAYATAKSNWDFVNETGKDPVNPDTVNPQTGKKTANKVNDTQRQQYYDAFVQAEATLRSAEAAVAQAQVAYDNARQAEVTGVQAAEQDVATAQSRVDALRSGGAANQLAAARAEVESAQAALNQLIGASRRGALTAAQAGIEAQQAALEKLTADPNASDLAKAEAAVQMAEVAVKQAQRELDKATLKAPFDATVAQVDLRVGEAPGASVISSTSTSTGTANNSSAQVVVTDMDNLQVKASVDELDVAQLKPGQHVIVTLDALPEADITGEVTNIAPLAIKNSQGTTTYAVTVKLTRADPRVLPGMTASVRIVTLTKENAMLVPRRAVQTENGQNFVYVRTETGQPDPATGRPPSERRPVRIGLSNDESIEITSGLKAGEVVLIQDVVSTFNPINTQGQ